MEWSIMLLKKLEMIRYLSKRNKKIKFRKSEDKCTSLLATKKAKQLLWKINSDHLPLLQNASYCYSFVWILAGVDNCYENRKYYVVDIYDDKTYARMLKNPAEIYRLPQSGDKISYTKLYNNINQIVKSFLSRH